MRLERQMKGRPGRVWWMVFSTLYFIPRTRIVPGLGCEGGVYRIVIDQRCPEGLDTMAVNVYSMEKS